MLSHFGKFIFDESGLEVVEWAIVGGVITTVIVVLFFAIGQDASNGLTALSGETSLIP